MVGEAEVVTVDDEGEEENSDDDLQVTLFTRTSLFQSQFWQDLPPGRGGAPCTGPQRQQPTKSSSKAPGFVFLMQANRCEKDSTFILWTDYK